MNHPIFIQPEILNRLREGKFVAQRRPSKASPHLKNRRNSLSPLAVTKRCIRYEPQVFLNRQELILKAAEDLNHPEAKVLLIPGSQGVGKTAMARGLVEMMGGGPEQLLWFDITLHSDFDEIIKFLIQYITYIAQTLGIGEEVAMLPLPLKLQRAEDPYQELEQHLRRVSHIPLLLVMDNMEFIVDPSYKIHSYSLKDFFNFLLGFPNIKLLLIGERLPYADLDVAGNMVRTCQLPELSQNEALALLVKYAAKEDAVFLTQAKKELATLGTRPWLLRLLGKLEQRGLPCLAQQDDGFLDQEAAFHQVVECLVEQLSSAEVTTAHLLTCLRHPVSYKTLKALSHWCYPSASVSSFGPSEQDFLSHSLLKSVLRRTFPPQRVLEEIRKQLMEAPSGELPPPEPWFELYRPVQKALYTHLENPEKRRLHLLLEKFYLEDKNRPESERRYPVKPKALTMEARFHQQQAQRLEVPIVTKEEPPLSHPPPKRGWEHLEKGPLLHQVTGKPIPSSPNPFMEDRDADENPFYQVATEMDTPITMPSPKKNTPKKVAEKPAEPSVLDLLLQLAEERVEQKLFDEAEKSLQQIAALEEALDPLREGMIQTLWGRIYQQTFKHRPAIASLEKALPLLQQAVSLAPDSLEKVSLYQGQAAQGLAEVHRARKSPPDTLQYLKLAKEAYHEGNHLAQEAEMAFQLAELHDSLQEKEQALQYYKEAFTLDQSLGHPLACAATLANIGSIYLEMTQYSKAARYFSQSLAFDAKAKNWEGQLRTYDLLAQACIKEKLYNRAEQTYRMALHTASRHTDSAKQTLWQAMIYWKIGHLASLQQQWEKALQALQQAESLAPNALSEKSRHLLKQKLEEVQSHVH